MNQPSEIKREVVCIHCKQAIAVPVPARSYQVWIGTCSNGHKALYAYPPLQPSK